MRNIFKKDREKNRSTKQNTLFCDLHKAQSDMELAYANFDVVVDPELIDAYIYELNAVQKRYCFLLQQARKTTT